MARIKNMGTSTMKFNEGIIASGRVDKNYQDFSKKILKIFKNSRKL